MAAKRSRTKTRALLKRAGDRFVGGVNSPVRSFASAGVKPIMIARGEGAQVVDYDGTEYIDYVLGFGAHVLGHSPVAVRDCQ